jgi:hypothetical protein
VLRADEGFRITREILERSVTERTRALLINSPSNPTGRTLDEHEAAEIAAFAADYDLVVVADEIYEKIRYDGRPHVSLGSRADCAGRTLTVNGFSKGYAMTGWRLGYLAGPAELVTEALKVQEHTVSCASSFVQRGGLAALTGSQEPLREMVRAYTRRRGLIVEGLNALPGITCAAGRVVLRVPGYPGDRIRRLGRVRGVAAPGGRGRRDPGCRVRRRRGRPSPAVLRRLRRGDRGGAGKNGEGTGGAAGDLAGNNISEMTEHIDRTSCGFPGRVRACARDLVPSGM